MYLNNKKIAIYNKDKKVIVRSFKKNDTPQNPDTTTFLLRREKDYNTNKISTFSDENNNYSVTINNMGFTEGNVEGYSGWTERGLQISNNKMLEINLSSFLNPMFDFDPTQIIGNVEYGFRVRGARFTAPTKSKAVNMPILGCGIYEVGDLVAENVAPTRLDAAIVPSFYRDVLGGGKTYRVYCSKTGYLPQMYSDNILTYNQSITAGCFYYTDDNLYVAVNGGVKTPTEGDLPTHNSGSAMWGDVELLWVATIGRIRTEQVI